MFEDRRDIVIVLLVLIIIVLIIVLLLKKKEGYDNPNYPDCPDTWFAWFNNPQMRPLVNIFGRSPACQARQEGEAAAAAEVARQQEAAAFEAARQQQAAAEAAAAAADAAAKQDAYTNSNYTYFDGGVRIDGYTAAYLKAQREKEKQARQRQLAAKGL